jgi:hypothetical protein
MLTLPLFALAILASGSPLDDSSPKVVALRFMALIKAKDWKAATAMLTDDAQFVVGHVGGPLNTETIPITDTVNSTKVTCTLLDTTQTDDRLDLPRLSGEAFAQRDMVRSNCAGLV